MNPSLPLKVVFNRVGDLTLDEYAAEHTSLDSPQTICAFWQNIIESKADYEPDKEHLVAILLDTKLRPRGYHIVSVGTISECIAHPREIFRPVIVAASYAFVLAHNHPSGDPLPSASDRRLTSRLRDGSELLQIQFLDHVIIGNDTPSNSAYFSFREAGLV